MRWGCGAALTAWLFGGCSFEPTAPTAVADPDAAAEPQALHLRVTAFVDGKSRLVLTGDQVHWFHLDYSAPGRLDGNFLPTTIDGVDWFPSWPDVPDAENRDCGCRSLDAFAGLPVPVPRAATSTTVTPVAVRGSAIVLEQGTVDNAFAVVVEIDDNDDAGAETYTFDLDIQPL